MNLVHSYWWTNYKITDANKRWGMGAVHLLKPRLKVFWNENCKTIYTRFFSTKLRLNSSRELLQGECTPSCKFPLHDTPHIFCLVGRYCNFASANLRLMVFILTCNPFSASLALASRSRIVGLRLNSATIILSSFLNVARVSSFPGRSSTVFVSLYSSTRICTKCLDFLSTLSAAKYKRCGPRAWVHKKSVRNV